MQMLAAGGMPFDRLQRVADEDNPNGYWELEAVKITRTSCDWLRQAQGKAVKMVHLLLMDLPREGCVYRVLLMKRRMAEVLASQRVMLQRQGKAGAALSEDKLSQIFLGQMQRVENWLKEQPHFAVLPVDYNALIANPMPQAAAINEFLARHSMRGRWFKPLTRGCTGRESLERDVHSWLKQTARPGILAA